MMFAAAAVQAQGGDQGFADDLVKCIRNAAKEHAHSFPDWGNGCDPETFKVDRQAKVLKGTLAEISEKHGYTGALWCTFYSTRMTGAEYNPGDPMPNNPHYSEWYEKLLCPWDLNFCGHEELGVHGDERQGVPVGWSNMALPQYNGEDRRTMSCGLCGYLHRKLGPAPLWVDRTEPVGAKHIELWGNNWDMHPFGAWLANDVAIKAGDIDATVNNIFKFRATNGEEIHGFAWQSLRLIAYDKTDYLHKLQYEKMSRGEMATRPDPSLGPKHALRVCGPTWGLSEQTRDDCSHGVGHGLFYFYFDIGKGVHDGCWTDMLVHKTPNWMSAQDALRWRWLCTSGVYHAAGNTLTNGGLKLAADAGQTAEQFLCKRHSDDWGDNDAHFHRCGAGLGMPLANMKVQFAKQGKCNQPEGPMDWERAQAAYPEVQKLTCNPAAYFWPAHTKCPKAFWAFFPCLEHRADYKLCKSGWHLQCDSDYSFHEYFNCGGGHRRNLLLGNGDENATFAN